ncbi:hypothetical protein L7F22_011005 [Adiantum nelumboides]|nr:hypothetical protein [Adiantum nelumboides]
MANASFPVFTGKQGEDAADFLDNFEIACVVSGRDDDASRERIFPLLMKMEARSWYNALPQAIKGEWPLLRARFEQRFGRGVTSEHLWQLLTNLKQDGLHEYASYESKFVDLWGRWVASLRQGDVALDFLKKDRFIAGLWPPLKEKVRGRFPETYDLAVEVACLKDKKLRLQNHSVDPSEGEVDKLADTASFQSETLYNIKKLDGTKFRFCKKQIWQVLVQNKQVKPLKLKGKRSEGMDKDEWEELDELACSIIMLTLAESVYFNVAEETTAYDVWQKLCGMYEKQSAASQIYWLKILVELKMKEGTAMSNHLNEFHTIFSQLTAQEIVFSDSTKAMFLLITLSDSWYTFRTALSNSDAPEGPTSANVEGNFLTQKKRSRRTMTKAKAIVLWSFNNSLKRKRVRRHKTKVSLVTQSQRMT